MREEDLKKGCSQLQSADDHHSQDQTMQTGKSGLFDSEDETLVPGARGRQRTVKSLRRHNNKLMATRARLSEQLDRLERRLERKEEKILHLGRAQREDLENIRRHNKQLKSYRHEVWGLR
jgi:hypothetical protein